MNRPSGTASTDNLPRPRRHLRLWLGVSACLGIVLLVLLWFWFGKPPTPVVPGEGLATTDPEILTAVEQAREAVFREPKSGKAWGKLAQVLHVHNFHAEALACYAEAERYSPHNSDWPYLRAAILLVGREPADAIPGLRRAVELGGNDPLPRLRLSEVLLDQGRFDEAAEELRRVLDADQQWPRVHVRLAQLAVARQDWSECLRHLDAVGDIAYARKQACSLRLIAEQRLGNAPAAQREQELLSQLPDDPPWPDPILDKLSGFQVGLMGRLGRAKELFRQGDADGTLSLLTQTVCDYPESDFAWALLGRALARAGDLPAAEETLWKSVELAPEKADVWTSLGFVRLSRQNPTGALDCYRVVIRLKPTDADVHCKVGQCLEATGDRSGALEAYRQALRYQPEFREARERLVKLEAGP
jgi:tetratricopeptide (TPR) repeat protein